MSSEVETSLAMGERSEEQKTVRDSSTSVGMTESKDETGKLAASFPWDDTVVPYSKIVRDYLPPNE